jgi:hypothetical protein
MMAGAAGDRTPRSALVDLVQESDARAAAEAAWRSL